MRLSQHSPPPLRKSVTEQISSNNSQKPPSVQQIFIDQIDKQQLTDFDFKVDNDTKVFADQLQSFISARKQTTYKICIIQKTKQELMQLKAKCDNLEALIGDSEERGKKYIKETRRMLQSLGE